jgi:hypothetical protein
LAASLGLNEGPIACSGSENEKSVCSAFNCRSHEPGLVENQVGFGNRLRLQQLPSDCFPEADLSAIAD